MILLEMIKKYEGIKVDLEKKRNPSYKYTAIESDIETVDLILKDLRSVEAHPSVTVIRDKILKEMDRALRSEAFDDAHTLAQTLSLLPEYE